MVRRTPLSRAAQILPFLDALDHLGARADDLLERQGLVPSIRERPTMLLSTRAAFGFVADMGRREGIEDFGWRVADPRLSQMTSALRDQVRHSPTLFHALKSTCAGARGESSNLTFWLKERRDSVLLCHRGSLDVGAPGSHDASLVRTGIVLYLIRIFTTSDWVPTDCGFATTGEIGSLVRNDLAGTRIFRTLDHGWIRLPRSILSRPAAQGGVIAMGGRPEVVEEPASDLAGSLAQALRARVGCYRTPNLRDAAEMAGMSVRSLQRELSRTGTSYRDILGRLKFEAARELLEQPDRKILDIAYRTGFRDPAHFTRFFRAFAGMPPRQYRATHLGGA